MWDKLVIDGTMGASDGALCFCPVELDSDGEITAVITGMNYIGDPPERMTVIGVVHEDGQEAAEAFYAEHVVLINQYFTPGRDVAKGEFQ